MAVGIVIAGMHRPRAVLPVVEIRFHDVARLQHEQPCQPPPQEVHDVGHHDRLGVEVVLDQQGRGHNDPVDDGAEKGRDQVVNGVLDERVLHDLVSASLRRFALSGCEKVVGQWSQTRYAPRAGHECPLRAYAPATENSDKVGDLTAKAVLPNSVNCKAPHCRLEHIYK